MTKKATLFALVVCAVASMVGIAAGGSASHSLVGINDSYDLAYGSTVGARQSGDSVQYITCTASRTSFAEYANCYAKNSSGKLCSCLTYDEDMVETIRSMSSASYISFSWDAAGNCTAVHVSNGSKYLP